jgi:hypothetical protein
LAKTSELDENSKLKAARQRLSEELKARQGVYLDYTSCRIEESYYQPNKKYREGPEIMAWPKKEAKIESKGRKLKNCLFQLFQANLPRPFEKESEHYMPITTTDNH